MTSPDFSPAAAAALLQAGVIRADEKVDPAKGTGVVMCCTFGDKTDVEWFQKHRLPLRVAIGPTGSMTDLAGPETGMYVVKARKAILARLEAAVKKTLRDGYRTADIYTAGTKRVSTAEMASAVAERLQE